MGERKNKRTKRGKVVLAWEQAENPRGIVVTLKSGTYYGNREFLRRCNTYDGSGGVTFHGLVLLISTGGRRGNEGFDRAVYM